MKTTRIDRIMHDLNHPVIVMIVTALVLLVTAWDIAYVQLLAPPRADAVPTPALPTAERVVVFTTAPVATPEAIQVAAAQPRWVTAWDAPDGNVLGPIPAPETSAITARYGDGWVMTIWQGAGVWLRAADIGLQIADLAPARVIVVSLPAPTAAPSYQVANEEQPPDWYHDIATPPPGFVDALTQGDPNAPACMGPNGKPSPLCGGITNRQAQQALDQQR